MKQSAQKTIIIVDDEPALIALYTSLLEDEGHEIITFLRADDALEKIPRLPRPALLLVDYTLNQMSGVEFVKALRERCPGFGRETVVAGFSNHPADSRMIDEFTTLVDFYFEKPNDIDAFLAAIKKLLERPAPRPE